MCATRHLRYGLTSAALLPGLFGYTEAQECYWPDGSGAGSDKDYWGPCTSSGGPCCREREACLSNGFCFGGTFGTVSRHDPSCPSLRSRIDSLTALSWCLHQ